MEIYCGQVNEFVFITHIVNAEIIGVENVVCNPYGVGNGTKNVCSNVEYMWTGMITEKCLFHGILHRNISIRSVNEQIEPVIEGLKKFRQYTKVLRDREMVSPITE